MKPYTKMYYTRYVGKLRCEPQSAAAWRRPRQSSLGGSRRSMTFTERERERHSEKTRAYPKAQTLEAGWHRVYLRKTRVWSQSSSFGDRFDFVLEPVKDLSKPSLMDKTVDKILVRPFGLMGQELALRECLRITKFELQHK